MNVHHLLIHKNRPLVSRQAFNCNASLNKGKGGGTSFQRSMRYICCCFAPTWMAILEAWGLKSLEDWLKFGVCWGRQRVTHFLNVLNSWIRLLALHYSTMRNSLDELRWIASVLSYGSLPVLFGIVILNKKMLPILIEILILLIHCWTPISQWHLHKLGRHGVPWHKHIVVTINVFYWCERIFCLIGLLEKLIMARVSC